MGEFKIWLDDNGIIQGIVDGIHDRDAANEIIYKVNIMLKKEKSSGGVLIDMSKTGRPTSEARKIHSENIKSNPKYLRKLALFGANTMNRVMANFIIKASGRDDMVKYFKNKQDAIRWLME